MILVLHALVFSGLLFCIEQNNTQVTLNNAVDHQIKVICSDKNMYKMSFEQFLKFYSAIPALDGIFGRSLDNKDNILHLPVDSQTLEHISRLIRMPTQEAHDYILKLPICDMFKILEASGSLECNVLLQPMFKNIVLLKFKDKEWRFFDKMILQKFSPAFSNGAQRLEPSFGIENYYLNYTYDEILKIIDSSAHTNELIMVHHWFTNIAKRSFDHYKLPRINSKIAGAVRVIFNNDWKRFTLITNQQNAIEFCYNYETSEYEKNSEITMLEDCWYRENDSRIGKQGRNFYKFDDKKRYLTNVDNKTPINHVTLNKHILAIVSEKKVILKDISLETVRSEKHLFPAMIKHLIPFKRGFLVQQIDGSVHQLNVGIKEHIKIALNIPQGCTIQRLMFNDTVLVLNTDNDPFNQFFYPVSANLNTDDRFVVNLTVPPSLLHFQDDAVMYWLNDKVYCYSYLQPFIDAVDALTTGKAANISEIYDTIAQNQ